MGQGGRQVGQIGKLLLHRIRFDQGEVADSEEISRKNPAQGLVSHARVRAIYVADCLAENRPPEIAFGFDGGGGVPVPVMPGAGIF